MPKMNFHMGITLRCYGNVEVEAESVEAAFPLLTADFVGENIDIKETTTDSGMDLAIIDVSNADTGEELADYGGYSLPRRAGIVHHERDLFGISRAGR